MKKEKLELKKQNKIVLDKDISKNIFAFTKINKLSLYKFLIKSSFSLHIFLFLVVILLPIVFALYAFYIPLKSTHTKDYLFIFFGISLITSNFCISSFLTFVLMLNIKLSDLQSRIALLGYKKQGFLLLYSAFTFTYELVSSLILILVFIICSIVNKVSFLAIINWPLFFSFIFSFLLTIVSNAIMLIILSFVASNRWSFLPVLLFLDLPIILFFNLIPLTVTKDVFSNSLGFLALGYNILVLFIMIVLAAVLFIVFGKFYQWKR